MAFKRTVYMNNIIYFIFWWKVSYSPSNLYPFYIPEEFLSLTVALVIQHESNERIYFQQASFHDNFAQLNSIDRRRIMSLFMDQIIRLVCGKNYWFQIGWMVISEHACLYIWCFNRVPTFVTGVKRTIFSL